MHPSPQKHKYKNTKLYGRISSGGINCCYSSGRDGRDGRLPYVDDLAEEGGVQFSLVALVDNGLDESGLAPGSEVSLASREPRAFLANDGWCAFSFQDTPVHQGDNLPQRGL